jgi:mannose/fructose/N-acetylgalactosamine-specific phosphotransferase system component IIB
MIVLVRIDDRLIHGQVVEGWVNHLQADCIMVADDQVAANPLQCSIMELAVPQGLSVAIGGVLDICKKVRMPPYDIRRVILLFSNPADVLRGIMAGLECTELNIGGLRQVPGKRKLLDILALDDGDLKALQDIAARGVHIFIRSVPTQRQLSLDTVLTACHLQE